MRNSFEKKLNYPVIFFVLLIINIKNYNNNSLVIVDAESVMLIYDVIHILDFYASRYLRRIEFIPVIQNTFCVLSAVQNESDVIL